MNAVGLANFKQEVMEATQPVVVDFWAPGCGPCMVMKKELAKIEADGQVKVVTLNILDESELAKHFKITGVPTLILFTDGVARAQTVGYQPRPQIEHFIEVGKLEH